jgi:hypothetical protein
VAWWMWLLIGWPVVAFGAAVAIGRAIRMAERRQHRRRRTGEDFDDADWDVA